MITPIYIALLALIFLYLSFKTISVRKKFQIAVGHGGNQELLRAMRVHANFSEYVPIALLLILAIEPPCVRIVVASVFHKIKQGAVS